MIYRKKPVVIQAITFDQLVAHGIAECKKAGHVLTNGMPWSFTYGGHHISHENDGCYLIPTLEGTMKMSRSDMLITGIKGEIYPCKLDIFEASYEHVPAVPRFFGFGDAIKALKAGERVARAGWNGKGMWLCLVLGYDYNPDSGRGAVHALGCQKLPWIGMKTADGCFVPWLASQTDMLADDWQIVDA